MSYEEVRKAETEEMAAGMPLPMPPYYLPTPVMPDLDGAVDAAVDALRARGEKIVFATVHGSHLYGTSYYDSDIDVYVVTESEKLKAEHFQTVYHPEGAPEEATRTLDIVTMGFKLFMLRANSGSHQAVEALLSRNKRHVNPSYRALMDQAFVCGQEVFDKYERTIRAFCHGIIKKRRHAVRLALNLADLRAFGRFNPSMTASEVVTANALAIEYSGDALERVLVGRESTKTLAGEHPTPLF